MGEGRKEGRYVDLWQLPAARTSSSLNRPIAASAATVCGRAGGNPQKVILDCKGEGVGEGGHAAPNRVPNISRNLLPTW
jgi:hypothetical protein